MFKEIFIELLQKNNLTAYMLSKETGISEALISQWKNGRQLPKYNSINILCDYFGCSADYLLGRCDCPTPYSAQPEAEFDREGEYRIAAFGGANEEAGASEEEKTT